MTYLKVPNLITVEVDSRERYPIDFPAAVRIPNPEKPYERILIKVQTQKVALPYGDYRLKEYPDCCVIERKAGQRELFKNIYDPQDAVRQAKSFRKLASCEFPYVLIELTPQEILRENPHIPDPDALMHRVSLVFARYGFNVLWIPWRSRKTTGKMQLGLFLIQLMLACRFKQSFEALPDILTGGYSDAAAQET